MKADFYRHDKRILVNKGRCKKCDTVIESKSTHDFRVCKCGDCYVDGGLSYLRRGAKDFEYFEELSEYVP